MMLWVSILSMFGNLTTGEAKKSCKKLSDCWETKEEKEETICFQNECRLFAPMTFECDDGSECKDEDDCTFVDGKDICYSSSDQCDENEICPYGEVCFGGPPSFCYWHVSFFKLPPCEKDKKMKIAKNLIVVSPLD